LYDLIKANGPGSADIDVDEAEILAKISYRIIKELKVPIGLGDISWEDKTKLVLL
jgi:hypothetical protein